MFNQDDSFFGNYGVESGYNQTAPGRDVAKPRIAGQPGRPRTNPVVQNAVAPPPAQPQMPQAMPFKGAQQTLGAKPPTAGLGQAIMGNFSGPGSIMDSHRRLNPPQGPATPMAAPPLQAPAPAPQPSWNTDGFATPQATAQNFGSSPLAGFDATKWNDANHQTPKYAVGRALMEASGGDGKLQTPEERAAAIAQIQAMYPGTTFDGKDKVNIPGVGVKDIFVGAERGEYGAAFQDVGGPAGPAPQGQLPFASPFLDPSVMSNAIMASGVPQSNDYAARIMQQIQAALSGGRL
jgi:hypothetical protein